MKKILFSFLLLLIGCQSMPPSSVINTLSPSPQATIVESVPASINTFQFSEQCPHLCWMGINPGVTTVQEAKRILSTSNEIDPKWLRVSDTGILAVWNTYLNPMQPYPCNVGITFENDVTKIISFGSLPFRIKDFTNVIGEPDKISVTLMRGAEGTYILYDIYFSSKKIMIEVYPGDLTGPDPIDHVSELLLNSEFNVASWQGSIQPWLGYEHIKDYLPGVEIPTDIPLPPTP